MSSVYKTNDIEVKTGNAVVDAMAQINITGNITPNAWYKHITRKNGKPHLLACAILADIVYWFRPSEVRDEATGQTIAWKKRFKKDWLQKTYNSYANLYGESRASVKAAFDVLVKMKLLQRKFDDVEHGDGTISYNVMFINLNVDKLIEITFGKKEEDENLPSPKILGEGVYDSEEVIQNKENRPSPKSNTNTKNTTKNTTKTIKSYHINDVDDDMNMDLIMEKVDELIGYDMIHVDEDEIEDENMNQAIEYNAVLDTVRNVLAYEVFARNNDTKINLGTADEPDFKSIELIKNFFAKELNYATVKAYIGQYLNCSKRIKGNATKYHIVSLYRQCLNKKSMYLSGGANTTYMSAHCVVGK